MRFQDFCEKNKAELANGCCDPEDDLSWSNVKVWNGAIDAAIEKVDNIGIQPRRETNVQSLTRFRAAVLAELRSLKS